MDQINYTHICKGTSRMYKSTKKYMVYTAINTENYTVN